jgi:hypothetical protein
MNAQPSYTAPPGNRWGTGADSVLQYLLRDLAQKPNAVPSRGFAVPPVPAPVPASARPGR